MREKLSVLDEDDGSFWISVDDFIQRYEQVVTCKLHPEYKYTSWKTQGSFSDNVTKKIVIFRVHENSHGFIAFSEVDTREFVKTANEKKYDYSFSRIAIGKIDPKTMKVQSFIGDSNDSERDSTIESTFEAGDYVLYFEQEWKQELRRDITLSSYAQTAFEFMEVNITDGIFAIIRSKGSGTKRVDFGL